MKSIQGRTRVMRGRGPLTRMTGLAMLLIGMLAATIAQATQLVADTTLVSGNESAVFPFEVTGPGTVSVQLTNLNWPQALSSLSFMATDASHVMASWSQSGAASSQLLTFQVATGGRYFADVDATAGGPLDLGAYSLSLSFLPAAPVPLPSSGAFLLVSVVACVIALMLRWRRPPHGPSAVPAPA